MVTLFTGIVLTVEPSDNGGAHRLVFNRSDGSVVPIGRRPGGEVPSAVDLHSAMFRCAVVSRKHAKIMFSDNTGHVRRSFLSSWTVADVPCRRISSI